jgi:hypothetical protein
VQKHLLDDMTDVTRPLMDEFSGTGAVGGGAALPGTAVTAANGARARLLDGAEPPFDAEAT